MPDSPDALLDRHLAGELSPVEQRALAQAALDDSGLFDRLATIAALKAVMRQGGSADAAIASRADGEAAYQRLAAATRWPDRSAVRAVPGRLSPKLTVGVGLAAAVVLTFVMLPRRPDRPAPAAPAADRPSSGALTAAVSRPRLLASRLGEPPEPRSRGAVSPDAPQASRAPKQEGSVVALAGGVASIDLGSLDGLTRGLELTVVRPAPAPAAAARLIVTDTFLERGRATAAGTVQVGDRIQTASSLYLSVLAAQVASHIAGDDLPTARLLAGRAVAAAESAGIPAGGRRAAFAQLGAVEYRLQALDDAERHYRAAQASLDVAPAASPAERARILNELGTVLIARGDYSGAADVLDMAQSAAGTSAVAGQVANNLAAVAALRGDLATAASLYTTALGLIDASLAPGQADRAVIEKNLAALTPPK